MTTRRVLIGLAAVVALGLVLPGGLVYLARQSEGIVFLNEVRYEPGAHVGAAACQECHEEIYAEWKPSRHAAATTAESVREVIRNLKDHTILNYMLGGEEMCYACHGPKAANEGINCETCHGPALPNVDIEVSHEKVFKTNRAALHKADFCAKCHEIPGWVTPYGDWQKTDLGGRGITCQSCHMEARDGNRTYHGFDSLVVDQSIYSGDITVNDVRFDFPSLTMTIQNHIAAHGVPAGGPTRVLSLEVELLDAGGDALHEGRETFAKFHRVMPILGFWPYEIVKDTQLKTGEKRSLSFTVPAELRGEIRSAHLVLKFYEVADEHEGNIDKAYFVSDPILEKTIQL